MTAVDVHINHSVGWHNRGERNRIWFDRWFRDFCSLETNDVSWKRRGDKVTCTTRATGVVEVWILTGEYDEHGSQLGVWRD